MAFSHYHQPLLPCDSCGCGIGVKDKQVHRQSTGSGLTLISKKRQEKALDIQLLQRIFSGLI